MTMTIHEAHRWASSFLQRYHKETSSQGSEAAREAHFTAELLIRHVLGWDRARYFAHLQDIFPEEQWPKLRRLVEEKSHKGVPLQHLLGSQEFFGRTFHVSKHVLIPRPETEGLVEAVLGEADDLWGEQPCTVVDVGTGSGAIAVTLAAERPSWHLTATDISANALEIAWKNAKQHGVESRIRFLKGDLLAPIVQLAGSEVRSDIIVSNPPYIPSRDIETLAMEVKDHEPRIALDGGEDGLHFYRRMAATLPRVTKADKGLVAVEVGIEQGQRVAELLAQALPQGNVKIIPDLAGIDRVVLIRWPSPMP